MQISKMNWEVGIHRTQKQCPGWQKTKVESSVSQI